MFIENEVLLEGAELMVLEPDIYSEYGYTHGGAFSQVCLNPCKRVVTTSV